MKIVETIQAYGHENIQATHKTTLEITKEAYLTKKGDCIIAVSADKALADLKQEFKEALRRESVKLTIKIETEGFVETVHAFGSSKLVLTHSTDMVVRKSSYVCARTLAVNANKAACDLSRMLVEKLKDPNIKVKITLTVNV